MNPLTMGGKQTNKTNKAPTKKPTNNNNNTQSQQKNPPSSPPPLIYKNCKNLEKKPTISESKNLVTSFKDGT